MEVLKRRSCDVPEVHGVSSEEQPQILRLHLAQNARQIALRMTVYFDMNFRDRTPVF
jgi:hypothetical protein